ncbi:glycerophosphodiester phosphodiesterase family protein [Gaetbulibacter aquiaggeris]|uniref:Glycerophosphodiester phosphodiesterase family protein n=1 Tax=Gaetbulibacter aquiaggeris TaxID=1735373 RepID=A0ABW7MTV5_9FLAO
MRLSNSLVIVLLLVFFGCKNECPCDSIESNDAKATVKSSIEDKVANLEDSKNNKVIVVSHRGDWRNAPENSLQAIQNCIDMGVDMVEIDIRETKDGQLVLMHDKTIDRTTTGKGLISEWTLDSLKTLRLVDGLGVATQHLVPTLRQALELSKDKILVNLDKSYEIFDKCYEIIKETGTQDQVVIKGSKKLSTVEKEFGNYLGKVHFMPIISLPNGKANIIVDEYLSSNKLPVAFEFTVESDTIKFINQFKTIREKGASIWVNALWPQHNAGHDDEKAVQNPKIYNWFIDNHIDIIQTDRPALLLKYLREKGLHD